MSVRKSTTVASKKTWELESGIQVQLNVDAETVTVRHNNEEDYDNSDAPDVRYVFSASELRGMLRLLVPIGGDEWKDLYEIEIYE